MDKNTLIGFAASLGLHAFLLLALYLCGAFGGSAGVSYKGVGGMGAVGLDFVGFVLEPAKSASGPASESGLNGEVDDNKELNPSEEKQLFDTAYFENTYEETLQGMDAREEKFEPEFFEGETPISKENALYLKMQNAFRLKEKGKGKGTKERKKLDNLWTDNTKKRSEKYPEKAAIKNEKARDEKKLSEAVGLRSKGAYEETLRGSGLVAGEGASMAAGMAAGVGATGQSGAAGELRDFLKENYSYISSALAKAVIYPEKARRRGIKGTCQVSFLLESSGFVSAVSLVKSSGSELLDREAIAAVHRASPFPPPPGAVQLTVPIGFVLR